MAGLLDFLNTPESQLGIGLLAATGVPLEADPMYDPGRLGRDRPHLWNGDME